MKHMYDLLGSPVSKAGGKMGDGRGNRLVRIRLGRDFWSLAWWLWKTARQLQPGGFWLSLFQLFVMRTKVWRRSNMGSTGGTSESSHRERLLFNKKKSLWSMFCVPCTLWVLLLEIALQDSVLLFPSQRQNNGDTERLSNLPKVTQPLGGRTGICT